MMPGGATLKPVTRPHTKRILLHIIHVKVFPQNLNMQDAACTQILYSVIAYAWHQLRY